MWFKLQQARFESQLSRDRLHTRRPPIAVRGDISSLDRRIQAACYCRILFIRTYTGDRCGIIGSRDISRAGSARLPRVDVSIQSFHKYSRCARTRGTRTPRVLGVRQGSSQRARQERCQRTSGDFERGPSKRAQGYHRSRYLRASMMSQCGRAGKSTKCMRSTAWDVQWRRRQPRLEGQQTARVRGVVPG